MHNLRLPNVAFSKPPKGTEVLNAISSVPKDNKPASGTTPIILETKVPMSDMWASWSAHDIGADNNKTFNHE